MYIAILIRMMPSLFRLTLLLAVITVPMLCAAEGIYPYITDLAISPKASSPRYLVQGDDKANVRVIDLSRLHQTYASTVVLEFSLGGTYRDIHNMRFSADGRHLLLLATDASAKQPQNAVTPFKTCRDDSPPSRVFIMSVNHEFDGIANPIDDAISVDFIDSKRILVLSQTELVVWNFIEKRVERSRLINNGRVVMLDTNRNQILIGRCNGIVSSLKATDLSTVSEWKAHREPVEKIYLINTTKQMLTAGRTEAVVWASDKRLRGWSKLKELSLVKSSKPGQLWTFVRFVPSDNGNLFTETELFQSFEIRSATSDDTLPFNPPRECLDEIDLRNLKNEPALILEQESYLVTGSHTGSCTESPNAMAAFFDLKSGFPVLILGEMAPRSRTTRGDYNDRVCQPGQGVSIMDECLFNLAAVNKNLSIEDRLTANTLLIETNNYRHDSNKPILYTALLTIVPPENETIHTLLRSLLVYINQFPLNDVTFPPVDLDFLNDDERPVENVKGKLTQLRNRLAEIDSANIENLKNQPAEYVRLIEALKKAKELALLSLRLQECVLEYRADKSRFNEVESRLMTLAKHHVDDYRPLYALVWLYGEAKAWGKQKQAAAEFNKNFQFQTISKDSGFGCPENYLEATIETYKSNPQVFPHQELTPVIP